MLHSALPAVLRALLTYQQRLTGMHVLGHLFHCGLRGVACEQAVCKGEAVEGTSDDIAFEVSSVAHPRQAMTTQSQGRADAADNTVNGTGSTSGTQLFVFVSR